LEERKLIKIVDEFVDHYYNGDYEIGNSFIEAHGLAQALDSYVEAKSDLEEHPEQFIYNRAKACFEYITDARVGGYVTESRSLITRLKQAVQMVTDCNNENQKLREQNRQLKDEITHLKKENERLTKLVDDLHEALSRFGPMDSNSNLSGESEN
jgi:DNA repair exonuclease SbcCD ATPase subunit